jgi:hypothetical protein
MAEGQYDFTIKQSVDILPALSPLDRDDCASADSELFGKGRLLHRAAHGANVSHLIRRHVSADAALHVDGVRHRLKVIWIDASMIAASVVKLRTVWDRAAMLFPRNTVSQTSQAIYANAAISPIITRQRPLPAAGVRIHPVCVWRDPDMLAVVVAANEWHGTALDPSLRTQSVRSKRRSLSASALTETFRIRFRVSKLRGHVRLLGRVECVTTGGVPAPPGPSISLPFYHDYQRSGGGL